MRVGRLLSELDLGHEAPLRCIGERVMGKLFRRRATDGVHSFTIVGRAQCLDRCVLALLGQGQRNTSSKIGSRNKTYSQDAMISSRILHRHESAHAVSDENNARRIKAQYLRHDRRAQIIDRCSRVFDAMGEGEVSRRSPGTPVVEVENIPSGAANILGQIEIALVTRKPMQQHHHWMRTSACSDIDKRVEERSVAGNLKTLHGSRSGLPGPLLCVDRRPCKQNNQCGNERQTVAQSPLQRSWLFCNRSVPIVPELPY